MNKNSDTIAAISSAPGPGGIAVVRVSGPESIAVADRIFKCTPPVPSHRQAPAVIFGYVMSGSEVLDEALLLVMRCPHSYTRENVVEIQCHGGSLSAKRILRAVLNEKIRLAKPGEFTKRAFVNGRIDLLQAEAVMDLINAQTERGATLAMEQMMGALSRSFEDIYKSILHCSADLESALDFIEDELPDSFMPGVIKSLADTLNKMDIMLSTWDEGHILRNGALVVISGKPNTGKSTLLNALLGRDRVIVSSIPGTTRDVIEEQITVDGIPIRLTDTAGLRTSECSLEKEGVRRARNRIEMADVNIYVIDASKEIDEGERKNIANMDLKKTIVVFNKIDLGVQASHSALKKYDIIQTQATECKGLTELKEMVVNKLNITKTNIHSSAISERHRQVLTSSRSYLVEAKKMLESSDESMIVLAASNTKKALEGIAEVIGKKYHEELLNSIFTRFCVGK